MSMLGAFLFCCAVNVKQHSKLLNTSMDLIIN
jgi:hypothetical protein